MNWQSLIFVPSFVKIFSSFKVNERTQITYYGRQKKQMELQFLFSAYCQMLLYNCAEFHDNIFNGLKV